MSVKLEIKDQISSLANEKDEMFRLLDEHKILQFGNSYQSWYSRALRILQTLGKDRIDEFIALYQADPKRKSLTSMTYCIQDYTRGVSPNSGNFEHKAVAKIRLINQFQILNSLSSRIDTVLEDVEGHLFTSLQDSELGAALELVKINLRAAGALAGVVLERHLQRVAINHGIKITKKNPTISDLNDPLKSEGIYDVPTWRKIQLLADIRNICSHQKDKDPSKEQVTELIDGVNTIIKLIY
ncbi:hypothetical protein [Cohnella terricola]|uniref:DUF4145 domain-containing protein n=1 Tax=Cohnella terricola TaxID=1289167 RepID=A0A559J5M8_9BACL|nr:hypothetical protein [Cohnella terricola]TVX95189.1 hypothetical protein FPZ45_23905 [Cohnella terricola]